jgi:hypothetical protein
VTAAGKGAELNEAVKTPPKHGFSGPKYQRDHYNDTLKEIHAKRRYDRLFLVNSVPKSGSTFTMGVLRKATDASLEYGGDLELEVEQTFSLSGLLRTTQQTGNIIYKFHAQPNFLNVQPIEKLDIRFINIVRNLLDTMISIDEHLLRGVNKNDVTLWPGLRIQYYNTWDDEKRLDFICDFIMPWYIRYIYGWGRYDPKSIVYYEEMVGDPDAYFARVAKRMGLGKGALDHKAVGKNSLRFNVGKIGRGEALRDTYLPRLRQYAGYYPKFDFSKVGL